MDNLQDKVDKFSWYQTIDFGGGIKSSGCAFCGDPAWPNIRAYLPNDLTGKRILDLGCNAGIFLVRAARMGAEAVGIEDDSWKHEGYVDQARFVIDHFAVGDKVKLIVGNMEEEIKKDIGIFDYAFGIASLYYAKDQDALIENMAKKCKRVIARIRDDSRIDRLTALFSKHGFELKGSVREKWWEKLGHQTDDFYLFYYENSSIL